MRSGVLAFPWMCSKSRKNFIGDYLSLRLDASVVIGSFRGISTAARVTEHRFCSESHRYSRIRRWLNQNHVVYIVLLPAAFSPQRVFPFPIRGCISLVIGYMRCSTEPPHHSVSLPLQAQVFYGKNRETTGMRNSFGKFLTKNDSRTGSSEFCRSTRSETGWLDNRLLSSDQKPRLDSIVR